MKSLVLLCVIFVKKHLLDNTTYENIGFGRA